MLQRIFLFLLVAFVSVFAGERAEYIRANFAKYEYQIPMRDGVKLFTSVYVPYDIDEKAPILLLRTPYSVKPYGIDKYRTWLGPTEEFENEGFIFVFQDVRGSMMSEGEFINMRPHIADKQSKNDVDESTDTWDTIEWLINNIDDNNGKVGQWGVSYPGFYTSAGMIDSHPALKAASPQAPIADWFWDDMHHHGAFTLALTFGFFSQFGIEREGLRTEFPPKFDFGTPDGYQFYLNLGSLKNVDERYFHGEIDFWNKFTQHPNYDGFWQSRNILPHLRNIKAAVMTVGGLYDAEDLYGPLKTYRAVEKQNPKIFNMLVMGPWSHGAWSWSNVDELGDAKFGFNTSKWFQERYLLGFFKHFLKDEAQDVDFPEALIFETGANRWRTFDAWPPLDLKPQQLYFHENSKLSFDPPEENESRFDEYISDPKNPVPYTKEIVTSWEKTYMTEDQRFAGQRPDVLCYTSDVLEEDLTLAGPLRAELFVSTSGTASDWVVKLIDVYPDDDKDQSAAQPMIRGDIFRGRYRESYETPLPFVPNEPTKVAFELQDVLHTFKRDHRIMVQIQSTWFPLFDRNPQTFVENIFEAEESDFIVTHHRVYHTPDMPGCIKVNVLKNQ
jgi:uncharacterized protein